METKDEEVTDMKETEDIGVEYLDIQAMEDACKRKDTDSISP